MSFWELNRYMKTNSVRGLYYPVSEDVIRQADRLGIAIVSEVPAVELRYGMKATGLKESKMALMITKDN